MGGTNSMKEDMEKSATQKTRQSLLQHDNENTNLLVKDEDEFNTESKTDESTSAKTEEQEANINITGTNELFRMDSDLIEDISTPVTEESITKDHDIGKIGSETFVQKLQTHDTLLPKNE